MFHSWDELGFYHFMLFKGWPHLCLLKCHFHWNCLLYHPHCTSDINIVANAPPWHWRFQYGPMVNTFHSHNKQVDLVMRQKPSGECLDCKKSDIYIVIDAIEKVSHIIIQFTSNHSTHQSASGPHPYKKNGALPTVITMAHHCRNAIIPRERPFLIRKMHQIKTDALYTSHCKTSFILPQVLPIFIIQWWMRPSRCEEIINSGRHGDSLPRRNKYEHEIVIWSSVKEHSPQHMAWRLQHIEN